MINNFDKLTDFLTFEEEGDFYYLQIIRRRKDNPGLEKTEKLIKNYYIENLEYLERKKGEIITLCDTFNARAYLRLNKRNYKFLTYKANKLLAEYMDSGDYRATMGVWDRVCGRYHCADQKLWVVDIDDVINDEQKKEMGVTCFTINHCRPISSDSKIKTILETSNGYHIITTPFDKKQFQETLKDREVKLDVDIKGDNPTNLYIP